MAFIQIMEIETDQPDELVAVGDAWYAATEGKRTLLRSVVGRDRNNPERYVLVAFFDDAESAMRNSTLPETEHFAARIAEVARGPLIFRDLDVIGELPPGS